MTYLNTNSARGIDNPDHHYHYVYQSRCNRVFGTIFVVLALFTAYSMCSLELLPFLGVVLAISFAVSVVVVVLSLLIHVLFETIDWVWLRY